MARLSSINLHPVQVIGTEGIVAGQSSDGYDTDFLIPCGILAYLFSFCFSLYHSLYNFVFFVTLFLSLFVCSGVVLIHGKLLAGGLEVWVRSTSAATTDEGARQCLNALQ